MMADIVVMAPPRCSYGPRPSTAAYSVAPSDQRSDPGVASPPRIRSGAVKPSEPITMPVWVSRGSPSNWAMPKSVSTARSSLPSHPPGRVGGGKGGQQLLPDPEGAGRGQPSLSREHLVEGLRRHELHHD